MSAHVLSSVGPLLLIWLVVCIALIVFLSAKLKLHPFVAIIVSTYLFGLGTNLIGKMEGASKLLVYGNRIRRHGGQPRE